MNFLKKGRGGGIEVSIFIMLLILFIIIYVILLPPAERDELLAPFEEGEAGTTTITGTGKVLLSESPGKLYPYTTDKQENSLMPMHLYSKTETKTQALAKSLSVSRNILKDNYKVIYFSLPDIDTLNSLKLLFLITESKGSIIVKINNHIIFEGQMTTNQLPLEMPLNRLQKTKNKLSLSVNSPLPNIIATNYYLLEDVKLIKESATASKETKREFFVDPELKVKSSKLAYFVNCNKMDSEGTLSIRFNGNLILGDKVFCEYLSQREIDLNRQFFAKDGNNELVFSIDKGDYNIDKAKLKTTLGRASYPTYLFEVDSDTYSKVKEGSKHAKIYFAFADSTNKKSSSVSVQGKEFSFETAGSSHSKDISRYIADGSNTLRITPKTEFDLTSLKVIVE